MASGASGASVGTEALYCAATAAADTRGFGGVDTDFSPAASAAGAAVTGVGADVVAAGVAFVGVVFLAGDFLAGVRFFAGVDVVGRGARGPRGAGEEGATGGSPAASAAEIPGSGGAAEGESVMSKGSSCDGGREAVTRPT